MRWFLLFPGLFLLWPVAGGEAQTGAAPVASGNHLLQEKSPYLLQHAHNPVDWYPWGEEAFAKARRENKPIFLSIGYSTCHWCHVMERESFENPAIAKLLNDSFIAIKVDREERPDVDSTYMTFVEATTGSGGWPMTVFATPELQPFAGGTYFPPTDRDGQPGLATILPEIASAWKEHRAGIITHAGQITANLQAFAHAGAAGTEGGAPGEATLTAGFTALAASYDAAHGGFGRGAGPKFPQPMNLNFLARLAARQGSKAAGPKALEMDLTTLRSMAAGGIHDQLGGGFHRYSTDQSWHVPHFEKMLYDQAQLAIAYLEAYQLSGEPAFAAVARDTLDYMRRDLRDAATGAFFSAEDADSQPTPDSPERVEGAFYVWKKAEIDAVLGPAEAALFEVDYAVKADGNVPPGSDPRGELAGKNVLIEVPPAAPKPPNSPDQIGPRLARDRAILLARRNQRPRPRRDDKTITAWNGLAISAFARAAAVLDDPVYLQTAQSAAAFLQTNLYDAKTGRLVRSYLNGPGPSAAYANDYAFLIQGLLDLYAADSDTAHLVWAESLRATQDQLFWDDKAGGYFDTALGQDPHVFLRTKNGEDNAEPSASAVSALNSGRLGQLLENDNATQRARRTISAFAAQLRESPMSAPAMLAALDFQIGPDRQIVVAGRPGASDTLAMLGVVRRSFLPNSVLILADGGAGQAFISSQVHSFMDIHPVEGGATAYVCRNYACQQPTTDLSMLAKLLQQSRNNPSN